MNHKGPNEACVRNKSLDLYVKINIRIIPCGHACLCVMARVRAQVASAQSDPGRAAEVIGEGPGPQNP